MAIDLNELATALGQIILRFRVRRRLAAEWTESNEVLLGAEIGLETDTVKIKFGDGATPWNSLDYFGVDGAGIGPDNAGVGIMIDTELVGASAPGGGNTTDDSTWSHVAAVVTFDGSDGDTTASDYSANGLTVTNAGTAVLTNAQSKFSATSMTNNGSLAGAGFKITDDPVLAFAANDWAVEGWFYPVATGFATTRLLWSKYTPSNGGIYLAYTDTGLFRMWVTYSDLTAHQFQWGYPTSGAVNYNQNAWNYIEAVRNGNTIHLYVNGVEWTTSDTTGVIAGADVTGKTLVTTANTFNIAVSPSPPDASTFVGYVGQIRITNGASRSNSVPTAAFPAFENPAVAGRLLPVINNTGVLSVVAGSNIAVDNSDPRNPVVRSTGGGGGGGDTVENVSSTGGVLTLDCDTANYFTVTMTENVSSLVIDNAPSAFNLRMLVTQSASSLKTLAWPSSFALFPTSQAQISQVLGGTSFVDATTFDAGDTWYVNVFNNAIGADDDLYASNVTLLLHFDGTNGQTTTTDDSLSLHTISAVGTAALSTVHVKYGTAATLLAASAGWRVADHADFRFGAGDFTVEFWFYPTITTTQVLFEKWGASSTELILLMLSATSFEVGYTTSGSSFPTFATSSVTMNAWNHCAVVRSGGNLMLFMNGVQAGSTATIGGALAGTTQPFEIGYNANTPSQSFVGYIDEFRVTKGVGRYTANFTPSTSPFPNP